MKVRKCRDGEESFYDDVGLIIQCPVCSDTWLSEDQSVGTCEHIRFVYCEFVGDFLFYGEDWDHTSFEKSFRKLAHHDDDDHDTDDIQGFSDLDHPDVDAVIYSDEFHGMGTSYTTYWGYKE